MGSVIIGISGQVAAGKSRLAEELAERLTWPWASFGRFVRAQARLRGLGDRREDLQELGERLIDELGWEEFCRQTLAHAGVEPLRAPCLVEGIRHVAALQTLRALFAPTPVRLIHVASPEEVRFSRLEAAGVHRSRIHMWAEHSTEREAKEALPAAADLVVPGNRQMADSVIRWLRESGIEV